MSSASDTQSSRRSMGSHDRKLRYRVLLQDLCTLGEEDDNNVEKMDKTANVVHEAQSLLDEGGVEDRVKHPVEGYLASRVLRATSDMAVRCSEAVSGNAHTYDRHELAQHIRTNPRFWEWLFPCEVPAQTFLFGTFSAAPREQPARAPRPRVLRQQAALRAPDTVDKLEKKEEGTEMVSQVKRFIKSTYKNNGGQPLSYFHTVLDPTSFSRTVENIYYLSFLVKSGDVSIKLDAEYELPFVSPAARQPECAPAADHSQFLVSIDMHRWQELINAFGISKPMMVLKR